MRRTLVLGVRTRAVRLTGWLAVCLCAGAALGAPGALATPPSWSDPGSVDPSFTPQQFSCASSSLCIVIGQSSAQVGATGQEFSVFNGSSWSALTATSTIDTSELEALSCAPGTGFCVATDDDQGSITYSGGSWGSPAKVGGGVSTLSCSTTTDCIGLTAVSGEGFAFNGTSWSAVAAPTIDPTDVSCASATLCVAVDASQASTYDGSTWSAPRTLVSGSGSSITSVSCAVGTSTCVAVDSAGTAYAVNSSDDLVTQTIDGGAPLSSVSCSAGSASAVDCVALDAYGGAVSTSAPTTSGSWGTAVSDQLSGASAFVSCSSDTACGAVDTTGFSAAAAGPSASWTAEPTLGSGGLDAVSCAPDTEDCTLVDGAGRMVVIAGPSISAPTDIDAGVPLTAVACPSTSACIAGDVNGDVITIAASGATASRALAPAGIAAISCPTTSFCDALDDNGDDYTYNGTSWSAATVIDSADNLPDALSCASASFCVATDFTGNAFTFNGSSWSSAASIDPGDGLDAVSCTSSSYCLAGDEASGFVEYNGSSWSSPEGNLSGDPITAVACLSAHTCQLGEADGLETDAGGQFYLTGSATADITSIACSSTAFCIAVDSAGDTRVVAGAPANTALPTISGTAAQGQTLTANPGSWVGSPIVYGYQWFACTGANSTACSQISGATKASYTIPEVTQAETFEVQVTGINSYGTSAPVTSAPTAAASVLVPADTTVPTVTGTAAVGKQLTATPGTWSGAGTLTYTYQWYLCAKTCSAITTATSPTLTVTTADIGRALAVVVYAHNVAGSSAPAVSKETSDITAPAATLAAWLSPLLHLSGTAGRLTRIKTARDYSATFTAAIAGTVKVSWTVTEKIAHTRRTKTVIVASVTVTTKAPSSVVKIKLTKTGITLLKKLKRERVKVTASFVYAFGSSTRSDTATRTLTLTR